jgi:hypothetical protein
MRVLAHIQRIVERHEVVVSRRRVDGECDDREEPCDDQLLRHPRLLSGRDGESS